MVERIEAMAIVNHPSLRRMAAADGLGGRGVELSRGPRRNTLCSQAITIKIPHLYSFFSSFVFLFFIS